MMARDSGRFVETSLPGVAGRDAPMARPLCEKKMIVANMEVLPITNTISQWTGNDPVAKLAIGNIGTGTISIMATLNGRCRDGWNIIGETTYTSTLCIVHCASCIDLAVAVTDCVATNSAFCILHSALYFPLYDANGNITAYVSETGEVVAQYAYDGFGRTLSATGPMADFFRHRFSTKYLDDETGFYYYGHRYYASELTRWTTRDPIGEDGGLNLYSFCGNDPINSWDALGNSIDDSEFENLGGLNYYDFRYQYVKAGGRRNPDLQNGFTSAVVSYKVDPEPCHEQACVKMIITQDVKIKGSMGWRLFVESYDPRIGPPSYEYDPRKQYTGRSGRTAKRHEELHLEHAIYHATQLDEELHNIATETCLSLKCYDAKEKYLKAVDTYYFFVRIHDDYELDFEDYPIEEANLLKKDLTFYANRVLKNGERLHQAQRKMEEVCR